MLKSDVLGYMMH